MKVNRFNPYLLFAALFIAIAAYPRTTGSPTKIFAGDGAGGQFGWAIDADDDRLVVGRPFSLDGNVFAYAHDGLGWVEEAVLGSGAGVNVDRLGFDVALDGDTAVVGATRLGPGGRAFVYRRLDSGWTLEAELEGPRSPEGKSPSLLCSGNSGLPSFIPRSVPGHFRKSRLP